MEISFDPAKNGWNIWKRGLSFERAADVISKPRFIPWIGDTNTAKTAL
jgi:uncharacterized DUF497 family protein